jgi:hypothetical protein
MNHRLSMLRTAAEKVTVRNPDQFAEVYGRLIYNEIVKQLEQIESDEPGELLYNQDTHLGWQIALNSMRVKLSAYFDIK